MFFLGDDVSSSMQVLECRIKILGVHASMYSSTDIACIVVVIIFLHCKKQENPMPTVKEIRLIGLATIRSCKHESDSALHIHYIINYATSSTYDVKNSSGPYYSCVSILLWIFWLKF